MPDRLGICQSCQAPARYRCPRCGFPCCSLQCSSAHKVRLSCSGIAPPVWSRNFKANEMTWGSLMRDQSYIAGVGRQVEETGRSLVQEKVIPQGRGAGRQGNEAEATRLDERNDKEDRMVREARNEGVELILLPKGMSKRTRNGTRWDQKNTRVEWTVEVAFHPRPSLDKTASTSAPTLITTVPHAATSSVYTVLNSALTSRDKKGKGKEVSPEEEEWAAAEREWIESLKPVKIAQPQKKAKKAKGEKDVQEEGSEEVKEEAKVDKNIGDNAETGEASSAEPALSAIEPTPSTSATPAPDSALPPLESESVPSSSASPVLPNAAPPLEPPFVLLLTPYIRPSTASSANSTPSSSRLPPKIVYLVPLSPSPSLASAALTLRAALEGCTVLETPLFELWPRESFLRQKLLGKLEVREKPTAESVRNAAPSQFEGGGARGRGRGRGRGGNTQGGRGARSEGAEPQDGNGGNPAFQGGAQDSGWGKRGPAAPEDSEDDEESEAKRQKLDLAIEALMEGSL